MAVFIIRGLSYAIYGDTTSLITGANTPPATAYFTDVTSLLTSQMAVFTVRAWKRRTDPACGVSPGCPTYDSFTCAGGAACELLPGYFADIEGHSHKKWIQKAREVSITTAGCGNGYYCPNSAMSRGASSLYVTRGLLNEFEY